MQHCWLQYVTDPHCPPVFPISDFLFKCGKKHWWCTEVVKFHSVVYQWYSLRTPF